MAVKWLDGAEIWAAAGYLSRVYAQASSVSASSLSPRVAPGAWNYSLSVGGILTTPSLGTNNTWTVGFGLQLPSAAAVFDLRVLNGASQQLHLRSYDRGDGTYGLRLFRGATQLAQSAGGFAINVWHYFELQVTVRTSTNGAYELRHNEVQIFTASGVNTANSGSDGATAFSFVGVSGSSATIDDIYVCDDQGGVNDDFLGDSVVVGLLPNGDGATLDFTPSTGSSHFALVDDAVDVVNDADYVSSADAGDIDLWAFTNLPTSGLGTIYAVQLSLSTSVETVGARTLRGLYRESGGSVANGPSFVANGSTPVETPLVMDVNPDSLSAWLTADIDDGQFGVEIVT